MLYISYLVIPRVEDRYEYDYGGGFNTVPSCSLQQQFIPGEGKLQPLKLPELQVPMFSMDLSQLDAFWLTSPWLNQNLTPLANLLNL